MEHPKPLSGQRLPGVSWSMQRQSLKGRSKGAPLTQTRLLALVWGEPQQDCTMLTNLRICNWQCAENETFWSARSALNPTFISKSSQDSGSYVKEVKTSQEPGTVVTPKEERLPGTAKLTPRWAPGDHDSMREMCASPSRRNISGQRQGSEFEDLPLTKKLFAIGAFWEKENQFSPVEFTECNNHTKQVPCSGVEANTKIDSMIFVCVFVLLFLVFLVCFTFFSK